MKRAYIAPDSTIIECVPGTVILQNSTRETKIHDEDTGGDDGMGGYDASGSLSRDNNTGSSAWDNAW